MEINKFLTTVDTHTAGKPLRIITGGIPYIKGNSILEKKIFFHKYYDQIRRQLMHEPRGHYGMYGCIITEPISEDADLGVIFMDHEGVGTICDHGIIAVATAMVETGILVKKGENFSMIFDTIEGKVTAKVHTKNSIVHAVDFENVPSFVFAKDITIPLFGREIKVNIAFGGAFYAIIQTEDIGISVSIENLSQLKKISLSIKQIIEEKIHVQHPFKPEIKGVEGFIFSDNPLKENSNLRNVTVLANGKIDPSPCVAGTSAIMALLHEDGKLQVSEPIINEGIISTQFEGRIIAKTRVEKFSAIIPKISGRSSITGFHQFTVDPSDPLNHGFLLG